MVGLPVLQSELRRRLWFQIVALESVLVELTGAGGRGAIADYDLNLPLNLNDSDLDANMMQAPPERTGATEMFFCLLRYTFRPTAAKLQQCGESNDTGNPQAAKEACIDELEVILGTKFLRYSDPVETLHNLTSTVARLVVCRMKWIIKHPRNGTGINSKDADLPFQLSLRILEYYDLISSNPRMAKYLWHTRSYFQWDTVIFLLTELQTRRAGEDVDRAWQQVEQCYASHEELMLEHKPLHTAVRNLTMKAWNAREAEMTRRYPGLFTSEPPRFITRLRSIAKAAKHPQKAGSFTPTSMTNGVKRADSAGPGSDTYRNGVPIDPVLSFYTGSEFSPSAIPTDWAQWDALIRDPYLYSGIERSPFDQAYPTW